MNEQQIRGQQGFQPPQFQITQAATWDRKVIKVPSGNFTYNYNDIRPNLFYIINSSATDLKVSLNSIPSKNHYEFNIIGGSPTPFGQPTPTQQVYFFNESQHDVEIIMFAYYGEFTLDAIRSTIFKLDGMSIQDMGVVTGFASDVQLPAGNKHLGSVGIDGVINVNGIKDYTTLLNTISGKIKDYTTLLNTISQKTGTINTLPQSLTEQLTAILNKIGTGSGGGGGAVSGDVNVTGLPAELTTQLTNILNKIPTSQVDVKSIPQTLTEQLTAILNKIGTGSGGGGSAEVMPEENYIYREFKTISVSTSPQTLCTAGSNGNVVYLDFVQNTGTSDITLNITQKYLPSGSKETSIVLKPNEYFTDLKGNMTATIVSASSVEQCKCCVVTKLKH